MKINDRKVPFLSLSEEQSEKKMCLIEFCQFNRSCSRTFEVATLVGTSFFQCCAEVYYAVVGYATSAQRWKKEVPTSVATSKVRDVSRMPPTQNTHMLIKSYLDILS